MIDTQELIADATNIYDNNNIENIQNMYGESAYGSSAFGSGLQAPANITATAISATPSHTPCTVGICTVNVSVTWTNIGGTDGSFVPNITIDGIPADPIYSSEILAGNNTSVTHGFTVSGLASGNHTICPYPN